MVLDWVHMAQDTDSGGSCEHTSEAVGCIRCRLYFFFRVAQKPQILENDSGLWSYIFYCTGCTVNGIRHKPKCG